MVPESFRNKIYRIIFGTDTPAGQRFDIALIYLILTSVLVLLLNSIESIHRTYGDVLYFAEWSFTILFSAEYFFRIYSSPKRLNYILSFYGIADLLSIIPTYIALFFPGANYWLIIRLLRVLRIFRVLKLVRYLAEANILLRSLYAARRKVLVFFLVVLVLSVIFGSLMFLVEGPESGFTSIPRSIYWTIVTITTVGYGDKTPKSGVGRLIGVAWMVFGLAMFPVGPAPVEPLTTGARDCHAGSVGKKPLPASFVRSGKLLPATRAPPHRSLPTRVPPRQRLRRSPNLSS